MKEPDIIRLKHMLDAARELLSFMKNRDKNDLEKDRILALAIVKEIEIIGEAASRASQEIRDKIPGIKWQQVVGMRNRLVHAYFEIDYDILWGTVIHDIPQLIAELEKLPELHLSYPK